MDNLERNIERAHLLNKETVLIGDFNIDYNNTQSSCKHPLSKELKSLNFKQLVSEITRPVSGTCLDLIFSNHPERISEVDLMNVGLSDHLPLFAVRKYACTEKPTATQHNKRNYIRYCKMRNLNEEQFKASLKQVPWDTVFTFDDVDDMVETWESFFNQVLDLQCPWSEKRVSGFERKGTR